MKKKIVLPAIIFIACFVVWACKKNVDFDVTETVKTPIKVKAVSAWSLISNGKVYGGCIDTAFFSKVDSAKTLTIGLSDSTGSSIRMTFIAPRGVFPTGAYSSSLRTASIVVLTNSGNYTVLGASTAFAAEVTNINDTVIEATFAARLVDPATNIIFSINQGKIRALIGKKNTCGTPSTDSSAIYTLQATGNICASAAVQGTYTVGVNLNTTNTVSLLADVTKKGQYAVATNTVNGITFSGSGVFPDTGSQTIILTAVGKPLVNQTDSIPVTAGSTNCKFGVTVSTGTGFSNAIFTPTASLCDSANVQGVYRVGTPLNSSNKIGIKVNVITPGDYAITTSTVNGMTFFGVGSFATTGVQNVMLTANGLPTTNGINKIPIAIKNVSCNLSVRVDTTNVTVPIPLNTWTFKEGTNLFAGPVTVSSISGDVVTGKSLQIIGNTMATSDTTFQLYIQLPTLSTVPIVGLYPTDPSTFSSNTTDFNFLKGNVFSVDKIYYAKYPAGAGTTNLLNVFIVNYDNAKRVVQGTFSGTILNKAGVAINITNGMFKADVR